MKPHTSADLPGLQEAGVVQRANHPSAWLA